MFGKTGLLLLAAIFASLSTVSSVPAGAAVGMDIDLIRNVKNYVLPRIIRDINALKLPRIDFNGGYVDGITFNFAIKSLDSIQFTFDPATNSIVLNC
jgi:hypothetical protein